MPDRPVRLHKLIQRERRQKWEKIKNRNIIIGEIALPNIQINSKLKKFKKSKKQIN